VATDAELASIASTYEELGRRLEELERSLLASRRDSPAQPLRAAGALNRAILRELAEARRRLAS
jgi:Mg2+ and Co2+ transporter CorA